MDCEIPFRLENNNIFHVQTGHNIEKTLKNDHTFLKN